MSNSFKSSFKNRNDRYKIIGHSLDITKEDRNSITKGKSKRENILKSLIFSDDKECHQIHKKMLDCKKFNLEKIKKDFKKYKTNPKDPPLIENVKSKFNYNYKETKPLNNFRDRPKFIGQYVNSKDVCQSLWCPNCRKFVSELYRKKISDRLSNRLLGWRHYGHTTVNGYCDYSKWYPYDYENEDFNHISGVLGLTEVNEDEVLNLIKNDTNRWRRIRYRVEKLLPPKNCPFIESVYEFELVNWEFLKNSNEVDFKTKQIQQLIEHQRIKSKLFLFVHFHSITNLTKDEINLVFEKEYFVGNQPLIKTNKLNGLYVQRFHNTQSLEKNIDKLTSYPFKDPIRFKHSFRGSDYLNGEYLTYEELSNLIKVYQNVQKRNWRGLFRTVEHPISMELLKYSKLFPPNHRVWSDMWFGVGNTNSNPLQNSLFPQKYSLSQIWVVDKWGNIYMEGWNPNNYFTNKKIKCTFIRENRKVLKRDWFLHPTYFIWVYKNIYESLGYEHFDKYVPLEGFYYTSLYGQLKRGKLFVENLYISKDYWGNNRGGKDIEKVNKDQLVVDEETNMKLWGSLELPMETNKIFKEIPFDITDPLLHKRLEVLRRLEEVDRIKYLKWIKGKYTYPTKQSDSDLDGMLDKKHHKKELKKLNISEYQMDIPTETSQNGIWKRRLKKDMNVSFNRLLQHHKTK